MFINSFKCSIVVTNPAKLPAQIAECVSQRFVFFAFRFIVRCTPIGNIMQLVLNVSNKRPLIINTLYQFTAK